MPGEIIQLSKTEIIGWAEHPALNQFPVTVHLVSQGYISQSGVADGRGPHSSSPTHENVFRFEIDGKAPASSAPTPFVLIGETDELVPLARHLGNAKNIHHSTVQTVETLLYSYASRHWVNGATHLEAQLAGVAEADIVELLYLDILRRMPDPEGLANYLYQLNEGICTFNDVRRSLLSSNEYRLRMKPLGEASGAIFSQEITLLHLRSNLVCAPDNPDEAVHVNDPNVSNDISVAAPAVKIRELNRKRHDRVASGAPAQSQMTHKTFFLSMESELFGPGWHDVEMIGGQAFRWMGPSGTIINPSPDKVVDSITLDVSAVYGSHEPMLLCKLDGEIASVGVSGVGDGLFTVNIPSSDVLGKRFRELVIESLAYGCPLRDGRGEDQRTLSLNMKGVILQFRP